MSGKGASVGAPRAGVPGAPRVLVYVADPRQLEPAAVAPEPPPAAPPPSHLDSLYLPDSLHPVAIPRNALYRTPDGSENRNHSNTILFKSINDTDSKLSVFGASDNLPHPSEFFPVPQQFLKGQNLKVDELKVTNHHSTVNSKPDSGNAVNKVETFSSRIEASELATYQRCSGTIGPECAMPPLHPVALQHGQNHFSESVAVHGGAECSNSSDRELSRSYVNYQFLEQSVSHQSIVNQSISILNQQVGVSRGIVSEGENAPQLVRTADGVVLAVLPSPVVPTAADSVDHTPRITLCDNIQSVVVPLGWRRIINGSSVLYIRTILVFHLILHPALSQEIRLESLDNGPGVLPFKLGPSRILSHYHSFLQHINLHILEYQINSINYQLNNSTLELNNRTNDLFKPHINYLYTKLNTINEQLQTFEVKRTKRGLIDGLGSVVKSITGNLDYTDALHYNRAIRNIQNNEDKLLAEFNFHVSLTKNLTTQYSNIITTIVENQKHMQLLINKIIESDATRDNDLIKYAHLAQIFLILSDNVDSVSQELAKLQNILAFTRISTMHHSFLSMNEIHDIIRRLNQVYGNDKTLDIDLREYYDIIRLGSYYVGNEIVIVYKFPIYIPEVYDLYKLAIVPNRLHEILIPPSPFLAIHEKDFKHIETECPKTSKWFLCEEERSLRRQSSQDCIHQLIITQRRSPICNPIVISLDQPAYEELDDRHYTISFPTPTKIHLSCGQDLYEEYQGSHLAIIPHKCFIETPQLTITNTKDRLKGHVLKIMDLPREENHTASSIPALKLSSINLQHLHATNLKISQHPDLHFEKNEDHILYHTTIPLYVVLISAIILITIVAGRRYLRRAVPNTVPDAGDEPEQIYTVPEAKSRIRHPPPQFTTKIFGGGCSTGGGVTVP